MKIDSSNDSFSEKAMNSFINGRHMEETQIISNSNHYTQVYYPLQHSVKPNIHTVQHHHNKDILNEIEREKVASEASLSRFYNYSATNVVRKNNNY